MFNVRKSKSREEPFPFFAQRRELALRSGANPHGICLGAVSQAQPQI
jgi:hypothetical protein